MKYGDAVVLVQKSPDGVTSRVNALVLAGVVQVKDASARNPLTLKNHAGVLPQGEYLDLLFLPPVQNGVRLKTNGSEALRNANAVPVWTEGAWIGWEPADLEFKALQSTHAYWTGEAQKKEKALQDEIERLTPKPTKGK